MIDIRKYIEKIGETGTNEDMQKLSDIMVCAIEELGERRFKYEMKIYTMVNGYHFDKCTLKMALDMIGGMKISCDEIMAKAQRAMVEFPGCVTKEDVSFVYHMFLSDYGHLGMPESVALKWTHAYITDEDFPIKNGKAFAEWTHKLWLIEDGE